MNSFSADIVVIGAGIIGAASAWRLAERGLKVVVVEQGSPASGSTGKSAAGVRHQFATETNILLAQHSIAEYAAMPESGYRPEGYLMLVPQQSWEKHQRGVQAQHRLGVPTETLTPEQAQKYAEFRPEGLGGCTFCASDGFVDPHGLTMEYVRRARAAGVVFRLDTVVTDIEREKNLWKVTTPNGNLEAPLLLNAAGAWASQVGALAGLDIPVQPARRMVFTTGPLEPRRRLPMIFDLESGVWMRSEGDRVIIGRADASDIGWREGMDWDWLEPTLVAAMERFPWLETASLDRRASWWGHYEVTPDHQAIIGATPGAEGWINACGFSGHGIMQAAAVARIVVQEAMGEKPFIDISSLRYERFGHSNGDTIDLQV
ncbi:FAD-binding oxidoreductase (plasmid) [Deinococcus radiomollis]|uniref:NAD(P)/FAD-dependent oxidoreductase n=1 Tax=Deinococcus radiomollis TaxID=468916 RepID=UPI0038922EF8